MAWIPFNPNPNGRQVGDCAIRAVAKATDQPWEDAYSGLSVKGFMMGDLPSANSVWGAYLRDKGFRRHMIPDTCPDCYTLEEFCEDHPEGMFIVAINNHVVAVNDGDYFDTWDSGKEMPLYYFSKERDKS